jgi:hypothetical protein
MMKEQVGRAKSRLRTQLSLSAEMEGLWARWVLTYIENRTTVRIHTCRNLSRMFISGICNFTFLPA